MMHLPLQLMPGADTVNVADSTRAAIEGIAVELAKDPNRFLQDLAQDAIHFGLKVLAALAIYIIGAWIIKRVKKVLRRIFDRRETDAALASFVISLVSITLTIILIVLTISALGVNTTSLAALLAAGGVAIGMALSGTVQNFAGGILRPPFKPFKAGDFIEAQGYTGIVSAVSIVSTKLTTLDNRVVIIPNGALANGNINNYSHNPLRRVDWSVSVSYGTDAKACAEAIMEILKEDGRVLDSQTEGAADPFVALAQLADSSINYPVRAGVKSADYWGVFFDFNRRAYTELPRRGFSFPFPQLDVHVKKDA